jgi:hypothetical protein
MHKKPFVLIGAIVAIAACNLSTNQTTTPPPPRFVDSSGHPYSAFMVQGHFMPYSYTNGVTHTVLNANLCLFTTDSFRFSELLETPTNITPDAYYEFYDTYSLSSTGKVTFRGQNPGLSTIGQDTISYFSALTDQTFLFFPDSTQLNQSCVRPLPASG